MATRKSRFDHLLFLQKVNECPFLYDINDVNYKDMILKETRWTEIGATFQMTGQVAQLKWKSLRDRFTREKKKYEDLKRNSEEEVPPPKWWLFTVIAKVLDRSSDSKSLIPNGDGFEERENDAYGPPEKKAYVSSNNNNVGESLSSFGDYHNNSVTNNNHHRHHLRNRRQHNPDTSRSSFEHPDSDSAIPADGDATTSSEIASAVHCEVRIDDDDDDDDDQSMRATNNNQIQHQHTPYKRKRSHVEDTMTEWTYQLSNCLLQRIVELYPPNNNGLNAASGGSSGGATESTNGSPVMDDVEYYVRSLAPRLRRLKAKDRGLVRLKIETALYEIESAGDE